MPTESPKQRAARLRELLDRANRAYYVDASPIMSDPEFDTLLAELATLERDHPELDDPDSPTHRVGGETVGGFDTVPHAVPMLSIDNSYSESDVREWYDRVLRGLSQNAAAKRGPSLFDAPTPAASGVPPRLIADPKIDGVALSLRYERGRLVRAVTRGDGQKGDDITPNARAVRSIPLTLHAADHDSPARTRRTPPPEIPEVLEVRGEVFIPLKEFERINRERQRDGLELFANPRNSCAGTLKQLDPAVVAQRRLGFVAHGKGEIVSDSPFAASHSELMQRLRALGIPTSPHLVACSTIDDALAAIAAFDK
ncbi:MAG: hypothetical protein ACKVW3_00810, partial [Phycisphaerales bacterium]